MTLARRLFILTIAACAVSTARAEGFFNGPVTFGTGDQAHPNGAKSFASITLGGTGGATVNTQSIPARISTVTAGAPVNTISLTGISQQEPRIIQTGAPQFSILQSPQIQYVQDGVYQGGAPSVSYLQSAAPRVTISQPRPSISVTGGATSHGYSVNAPGLTKTATFGYSPSSTLTVNQGAPRITAVQAPRLQLRVPQQQIQLVQQAAPQVHVIESAAPQISLVEARTPQLQFLQAPAQQIRIQQAPAPQLRIEQAASPQIRVQAQQPRISVSGPATSHGYTVNAPGLTKTATFGYPSGAVSITQSAPRVSVSQAPKVQLRVAQPQVQVIEAPAPQIRIQQAPAPQIRIQQAPAPQIRIQQAPAPQIRIQQARAPQIRVQAQQPRISVSGPATSHGYTVNAPGLTKTATFGYPAGGVTITQSAPRVSVSQNAPRLQVRVPQQQLRVIQSRAPQISVLRSQGPQISVVQAPAPQIKVLQAPAQQLRISAPAPRTQVRTQQPSISVSGPATSHGYTVNAPGLTKTATFGYPSGGVTVTQSAPRVTVSRAPAAKLQVRVPQQQIRVVQAPAPQIRIQQAPAPQIRVVQEPAAQFRIATSTPQIRVQAQRPTISVSGPATSHGYTVNAPGLTKTATFGYPSGGVSITQSAPRVSVTQQAPKLQVRVPQQQIRVVQAPAPQIRIQQQQPQLQVIEAPAPQISLVESRAPQLQVLQAPAPQIRIQQAPAPQLRVQTQQPRVAVSGPATSHGYTVNAPGLTKTATFGYPSGGVTVTQSAPRVTVTQQPAPKLQFQVAQPQLQVLQAPSPQIRIHQSPAPQPQLQVLQGPAPQLHLVQSPGPQVHLVEAPTPKISLLHAPAPQVHLVHAAPQQVQFLQHAQLPTYHLTAAQPQISVVKSYQPQVHVVEAPAPRIEVTQPQTRTIQLAAPKTVTASISGYSPPSVRQQAFNTPAHGYSVSAPGFTKHKTFAGPAVYGTHQGGGVSGASGIGNVDFSVRQPANAKKAAKAA